MRLMIIKQPTDLKALTTTIATTRAGGDPSPSTARLKALNPHLDFERLEVGNIVVLPDSPEIDPKNGQSLGGDAFALLASDIEAGFQALTKGLRATATARADERATLETALDVDAVRRAVGADEALKKQLESRRSQAAADQEDDQGALKAVTAAHKAAVTDLKALARLFP